jgi:hypothetical protein
MSGLEPQASTSTAPVSTSQDQNTDENIVSSTADVPGPSWAVVDEDVATTDGEARSIPEASTGVETLAEDNTSHNDLRQRRLEHFSSQPNDNQDEE